MNIKKEESQRNDSSDKVEINKGNQENRQNPSVGASASTNSKKINSDP